LLEMSMKVSKSHEHSHVSLPKSAIHKIKLLWPHLIYGKYFKMVWLYCCRQVQLKYRSSAVKVWN